MFNVNNDVNVNLNAVALVALLLTLNIFHIFFLLFLLLAISFILDVWMGSEYTSTWFLFVVQLVTLVKTNFVISQTWYFPNILITISKTLFSKNIFIKYLFSACWKSYIPLQKYENCGFGHICWRNP